MNLTALTTALRNRLGVPSTDGMFADAVCTELLNNAIQKINGDHDWGWLEKSETIAGVNGQSQYTPAADWLRTLILQWSDYPPMERVSIDRLRSMGSPAGRPVMYAVITDKLDVRPVPTTTTSMTHLYIRTETLLASGSDAPLMPAPYQWVIVEYAAYLGFRRIGRLDEAGGAQAAYDAWLKKWLEGAKETRYSPDIGGGAEPAAAAAP